ncbi:MAG TPA: hypothetical protein VNS62_11465 [Candidatus Udaeobacter sp.]|nr:hypothetical protein [Candidatus Udaeobacter sp.]
MRCAKRCCSSCALTFRRRFQALFLAFQQFVKLFDQLQKTVVVLFLFNLRAQLVHAFSIVCSHRRESDDGSAAGGDKVNHVLAMSAA